MPTLIDKATFIAAAGNKPKRIEEFVGRANSGGGEVSIAKLTSPPGWVEPGQKPEFTEYTVVLSGVLHVEHEGGVIEVRTGQAVVTEPGEWFRYSTPEGAEYVAATFGASSDRSNVKAAMKMSMLSGATGGLSARGNTGSKLPVAPGVDTTSLAATGSPR